MDKKVTFYTHVADKMRFCCALAQKAFEQSDETLWIVGEDSTQLAQLDTLLWTFEPNSFLAHDMGEAPSAPIMLCLKVPENAQLVLNLSDQINTHAMRVLELVAADDLSLQQARQRFVAYRAAGFNIEHHNMTGQ